MERFKKSQKLDIVLWSFSAYADVLQMTIGQLEKFAPNGLPIRVFILGDSSDYIKNIIDESEPIAPLIEYEIVLYRENLPFWMKINQLKSAGLSETFLFLQDDFVLFEKPDWVRILSLASKLEKSPHKFFRLVPSGYKSANPKEILFSDMTVWRVNYQSHYHFSCQATIWKKRAFLNVNRLARPTSIRDENNHRYRAVMRFLSINGLCSKEVHFPYIQTAIREGRWDYAASVGGTALPALLEAYSIEPSIRGIRQITEVR